MGRRRKRARSPRGVSASIEWGVPGRWLGRARHSNGRSTARVTGAQPGDRGVQRGVGRRIRPAGAPPAATARPERSARRIRGPPHRSSRPPSAPARRRRPSGKVRLPALKPRVGAPNERVAPRLRNATASTSAELAVADPSSTRDRRGRSHSIRRAHSQLRVVAEPGLAVAIPDGDPPAVGVDGGRELALAEQRPQAREHRPEVAAGVLPQVDDPTANSCLVMAVE